MSTLIFVLSKIKPYYILCFPALFLHQLSHIVVNLIGVALRKATPYDYNESYFTIRDGWVVYGLQWKHLDKPRTFYDLYVVPMSPLLLVVAAIVSAIITLNTWLIVLACYLIVAYKISFPCQVDWWHIKYAKLFMKYPPNEAIVNKFINIKIVNSPNYKPCQDLEVNFE